MLYFFVTSFCPFLKLSNSLCFSTKITSKLYEYVLNLQQFLRDIQQLHLSGISKLTYYALEVSFFIFTDGLLCRSQKQLQFSFVNGLRYKREFIACHFHAGFQAQAYARFKLQTHLDALMFAVKKPVI